MTPEALAKYVRLKTRTNSTTFTDADLLILANFVKEKLTLAALDTDEDLFRVPTYLNLVANQREYPLHSDLLSRIEVVWAKLDGENWIKLTEIDLAGFPYPLATEADIVNRFSNDEGHAFFDIARKALMIYSGTITAVTAGLQIFLNTWPADFITMAGTTDMSVDPSTTTHGFPRELHGVLAEGMVIEWKQSREKPIPLTDTEMVHEDSVNKAIRSLKRGSYDRVRQGRVKYNDGSQY